MGEDVDPRAKSLVPLAFVGLLMRLENHQIQARGFLNGVNADVPEAGYYRRKLVSGGVDVAIKIWYGFPYHPETGDISERRWGWHALRDGELVDVFECWPGCSGARITEDEYNFMLADAEHCRQYIPSDPKARPRERIELRKMAPILPPGM